MQLKGFLPCLCVKAVEGPKEGSVSYTGISSGEGSAPHSEVLPELFFAIRAGDLDWIRCLEEESLHWEALRSHMNLCCWEPAPCTCSYKHLFSFLGVGWEIVAMDSCFSFLPQSAKRWGSSSLQEPSLGPLEFGCPFTRMKYSHGWLLRLTWPLPSSLFPPLRLLHSQASRNNGGNCASQRFQHFNQHLCTGSNKRHSSSKSSSSISQPFITKLPSCVPSPPWVSVATKSKVGCTSNICLFMQQPFVLLASLLVSNAWVLLVFFVNKRKFSTIWKLIFWYLTCYTWSTGWETLHPTLV